MNRRNFCQSMLLSPILSPLFLRLKPARKCGHLYLINDRPHLFLPQILHELEQYTLTDGRSFTILDSLPVKREVREALLERGWKYVFSPAQASLILSFHHLEQEAAPSFTLVKQGHILDIRTKPLSDLWAQISSSRPPSDLLTAACFNDQRVSIPPGKEVNIYSSGRLVSRLPLKKNIVKTLNSPRGSITVHISDHKAWVSQATCPHQICRYMSPISSSGEKIVCAPGHFLVEIVGSSLIDTVIG